MKRAEVSGWLRSKFLLTLIGPLVAISAAALATGCQLKVNRPTALSATPTKTSPSSPLQSPSLSVAFSAPSQTLVRSTAGLSYTVTYSGASSISLSSNDVVQVTTGTASCLAAVGGSGTATRTILLFACSGDGTVSVSLNTDTARDTAGLVAPAAGPSASFTVDNTPPSIAISAPSTSTVVATSGTATYTVTYSGTSNVTLTSTDILFNTTAGSSCSVGVTGSGLTTRTVILSNCLVTGGTVGITLAAGTASDTAGNYSLAAGPATTVSIIPGPANKLAFSTQPSNTTAGQAFSPSVVVQVQDVNNNLVTPSSAPIALGFSSNPGSGVFSGTTTVSASGGIAIFAGVSINKAGANYRIYASTGGLSNVYSSNFNITAGTPTQLLFITPSPSLLYTGMCSTAFTLQTQDGLGNVSAVGSSLSISLTQTGAGPAQFFTSSNCSGSAVTSVTLPALSSQVQFYSKDSTPENLSLTASGGIGSGLSDAVSAISVVRFTNLASGFYHTCGVLSTGGVQCWGDGSGGKLGNGSLASSAVPVTVPGLSGVSALAANYSQTFALMTDGTIKAWGSGYGNSPIVVAGVSGVTSIASSSGHICALLTDTSVKCWGSNVYGESGNGSIGGSGLSTPTTVSGLTGVISLSVGYNHVCAVVTGGTVKCWGFNYYGQLGIGTTSDAYVPTAVTGIANSVSVAAGGDQTCAILSDSTAKCWGNGSYGQLGTASASFSQTTPVVLNGISGITSLVSGGYHSCAILTGGTVKCWGHNTLGQTGVGSTADTMTPTSVSSLSGVTQLSLGDDFTCAVLSAGTPKCWGNLGYGTSGYGGQFATDTPTLGVGPTSEIYAVDDRGSNGGAGSTSLWINKPTGVLVGRTLLAAITLSSSTPVVTPPAGWTLLQSQSTANIQQNVYYKIATSGDVGAFNYGWNFSSSAQVSGNITVFANTDAVAPVIASSGLATTSSATITAPTISTTETDFESVVFYGTASSSFIVRQAGYTGLLTNTSAITRTSGFFTGMTAAGPTGNIVGTGPAADNVGQQVLLKRIP